MNFLITSDWQGAGCGNDEQTKMEFPMASSCADMEGEPFQAYWFAWACCCTSDTSYLLSNPGTLVHRRWEDYTVFK